MKTYEDLGTAIERSISHNEIVRVERTSENLSRLGAIAEWHNTGNEEEEYGGTCDGGEWRVHVARFDEEEVSR